MNMKNAGPPSIANGKICYLEIPARDAGISSSFFREVFGWNLRTRGDGHIAFDDTTGEVSGSWITGRSTSTFAGLLIYIMVDDISETLNRIVDHGGGIVQPSGMDAPELTARFSDPAGNIFGLYQEPEK
jgi:predicted enzyme related to lactoylglutathione lyase